MNEYWIFDGTMGISTDAIEIFSSEELANEFLDSVYCNCEVEGDVSVYKADRFLGKPEPGQTEFFLIVHYHCETDRTTIIAAATAELAEQYKKSVEDATDDYDYANVYQVTLNPKWED